MSKIKFVLLTLFLFQLIGKTVDAQLVTNKAVLERAGLETAQREKNDLTKLLSPYIMNQYQDCCMRYKQNEPEY